MVVIFCGRALALDKDTMLDGNNEEKQEHLMAVLGEFLEERVQQIVGMISSVTDEDLQQIIDQEVVEQSEFDTVEDADDANEKPASAERGQISDDEMSKFLDHELPGIDDPAIFRENFG
jgi:hypothetical protein